MTDKLANIAIDKQKMLLSADVGHFSLVRALHLADLITLMNGARTNKARKERRPG